MPLLSMSLLQMNRITVKEDPYDRNNKRGAEGRRSSSSSDDAADGLPHAADRGRSTLCRTLVEYCWVLLD
jgi:hypothetical protein